MAELSKIKLNGTEYDLKDAVARQELSEKRNRPIILTITKYDSETKEITDDYHLLNKDTVIPIARQALINNDPIWVYDYGDNNPEENIEEFYLHKEYRDYEGVIAFWDSLEGDYIDGLGIKERFIAIAFHDVESYHAGDIILYTTYNYPVAPTTTSQLTNNSGFITSNDLPTLATVATSGDYDDLTDAPVAETDANVEDMLDGFNLDYTTSPSASINVWQGGNY